MEQQIQHAIDLLSSGKADKALKLVNELNESGPANGRVLEVMGHCFLALGDNDNARKKLILAHQLLPDSANLAAYLGGIYHTQGNLEEAIRFFTKAVEIDPNYHQAWHFLSLIYFQQENLAKGLLHLEQARTSDPFSQALNRAKQHIDADEFDQASQLCQQILKQHRSHPRALCILSTIAINKGQLEEAETYLFNALNYSPYDSHALTMMTQLQAQLRQYKDAISSSEKLVRIEPNELRSWQIHADNLLNAAKFEQALAGFKNAGELAENDVSLVLQQAHIHKILGNTEEAMEGYLDCTASDATKGSAYWALANFRGYQFTPIHIQSLDSIRFDPDFDPGQACQACFALAKHYEDIGNYKQAFSLYRTANMNHSGNRFVPAKYQEKCYALKNTFSPEILTTNSNFVDDTYTSRPIFIVGLPRSGSTLVEQILASHSQIEGTMELKTLPAVARKIFIESCKKNANTSGSLKKFSSQELLKFGQWYMHETEVYRSGMPYFIDKLPPNFQHIGLIKMILPQAIIIDVRRQPLACGMGIYKQYFANGHDFGYDLKHIGFYYNQYLSLMDYWHQVMPKKILTMQYEVLVEDTENQVKEMLAHCELTFEAQCLEFHRNSRAVRTASSDQVRQPINKKGLNTWKHYREDLSVLFEELGPNTLQRYSKWID